MGRLSPLRWLFAWIAILGMLSLPLATAQAMDFDHGSMTVTLTQMDQVLSAPGADPCCVTHKADKTLKDCGKTACVSAASCMTKCVPGTPALAVKATGDVFGPRLVPSDEVTTALYGPEPPMEPPRS